MPQTREHLAVLRALGVARGVVAITKADVADPGPAAAEAAERLPGIEAVPLSAPTGVGLGVLLAALDRAIAGVPGRSARSGPARLHVDRVFTLRGIGTVVTGTLWSGRISRGDDREAGLRPTYRLNASVSLEPDARPLGRGTRVQVHHGTREAAARVVPLEGGRILPGRRTACQLRLEAPLMADRGDAVVLRQIAPLDTIGGGRVLDPAAPRSRRRARAAPASEPAERVPARSAPGEAALRLADLLRRDGERPRADGELEHAAGLSGPAADRAWRELESAGLVVRAGANLHFDNETLEHMLARVVAICRRDGGTTIAQLRDELGTSRRYAQALLEHLDGRKVTIRRGDRHELRRRVDR